MTNGEYTAVHHSMGRAGKKDLNKRYVKVTPSPPVAQELQHLTDLKIQNNTQFYPKMLMKYLKDNDD